MRVKIGSGSFRLYRHISPGIGRDVDIELERAEKRQNGIWYCGGRPSVPDPLRKTIESETNILIFSPPDKGTSVLNPTQQPSQRQISEMTAVANKFMGQAGLQRVDQINKTVQDTFGTYSFAIPWDEILDKSGLMYSVSVWSVVRYRVFELPQVRSGGGRMFISLPFRADHFARQIERCTETGAEILIQFQPTFVFKGEPVAAKTDTAKKLRQRVIKDDRAEAKRRIKVLEEELKDLKKEQEALKKD